MLEVKNLSLTYIRDEVKTTALKDISFTLELGETLALLGKSGSGKSSLINAILKSLPLNAHLQGEIIFPSHFSAYKDIAYIPQNPHSALNPVFNIGEQIKSFVKLKNSLLAEKELQSKIEHTLSAFGLSLSILKLYPHQLSGGMKQRLLIAIASLNNPKLLIADEPTSSIDSIHKREILELIINLKNKFQLSTILITHDLKVAEFVADKIAVLSHGKLVELQAKNFFLNSAAHPASLDLLNSQIGRQK